MKVSISYAHTSDKHKEKVLRLVNKLAENGIEPKIDYYDFDIGDDLYYFMEDLTLSPENDYVLAICNQRYKEKADNYEGGVGIEASNLRYIASKPKRNKVLPVIFEKDENGDAVRPNFLLTLGYVDLADDEDFTSDNFIELVNWLKGIRKVKPKINPVPEFQNFYTNNAGSQLSHYNNLPFRRKENLIARNDTVVNKIASYFEENKRKDASIAKPVLLQTWSGNGKSTIAAEFAYRYGSQFIGTFWFDCNHSLIDQFEEIAHLLEIDIPASKTKQEKRHLCIDFTKNFINNRSCLLIFDNLLYFNTIEEFLPKSGKSRSLVLTTNSSQKHYDFFRKIPIEKIRKEEALSLLLSGLDYDVEDVSEAEKMVEYFDRLPFALELANSFLKDHNPVNITHFLNEIKERSIEWEGLVKTDSFNILHSSPSLLALIERNFERLKNYKEGYNELLNIVSVIGCLYLIKDKLDFHLIKEILGLQDDIPTDDITFKKIAKYICDTGFSEENSDGFIIHSIYLEFFKLFHIKQPELFQTTQVKLKNAFQMINTQVRMGAWLANSLDKPVVELLDYSLSKHSIQEEHQIQTYFNLLISLFDVQSFYGSNENCLATIAKASNLLEQAAKAPSFLKNELEFLKGETLHKMKRYDDAYNIYKKLGSSRAAMRLKKVIYLHVYTGHIHRIRREWIKAEKNYLDAMLQCIEYREQQTDEQFLTNKLSIQLHQKCLFDQTDDRIKLQRVELDIDKTIDKLLEFSSFGREEFKKSNPHHYPFEIGQQLIQKCSTLPLSPVLPAIVFSRTK